MQKLALLFGIKVAAASLLFLANSGRAAIIFIEEGQLPCIQSSGCSLLIFCHVCSDPLVTTNPMGKVR